MESPSRILEAVKFVEVGAGLHPGGHLETVCDAARFPTLLYQSCGECGGSGFYYQHLAPWDGPSEPCPSCGGSGEVPIKEAIEVVYAALSATPPAFNDRHDVARAVLMALRTIGDEG